MSLNSHCRLIFCLTGIGHSVPRVSFFETAAERAIWMAGEPDVIDPSTGGVALVWAQAKVVNQLAGERQSDI